MKLNDKYESNEKYETNAFGWTINVQSGIPVQKTKIHKPSIVP